MVVVSPPTSLNIVRHHPPPRKERTLSLILVMDHLGRRTFCNIRLEITPPKCCVETLPVACLRSSTTWEDEEEDEYSEGAYFVSEYELKIYNVYKDDLNFTYPNTPRAVEFFSSGLDIDSCRLDLDVGNELVVDLYEEEDGSFSSYVCSATRAIEFLSEDDIECLESGGYS